MTKADLEQLQPDLDKQLKLTKASPEIKNHICRNGWSLFQIEKTFKGFYLLLKFNFRCV